MYRLGLTALACATAVAGCGGADREPSGRVPTPAQRLELGVVGIAARIGGDAVRSSGVVVDADAGLILTTAHTVWGATSLELATRLGIVHGRIVARAPCDDLALIETYPRIPGLLALAPAPGAGPVPGRPLRSVGRRADPGALLSIPVRATGAAPSAPADPPLREGANALDAPLVPEVSGGPLLDAAGRVVGLAVARPSARGRWVPWARIRQRLAQLRPGPREVYVGWRDQYRCVRALTAYARASHPGFRPRDARLNAPVPATRPPGTGALDR
jgi:S1-C subfamily serine protease